MKPTLVDLFCGAGGLSLGFRDAGFQPVYAADWDGLACKTYEKNLGPHVQSVDLGAVDPDEFAGQILESVGEVDVVAGGPPCQGFSIQRRGAAKDPRNELATQFAKIAVRLRPKAIVMENVPTILGSRGQQYVSRIFREWEQAGYEVNSTVLQAADFGVPQLRRRAFIVAIRDDLRTAFDFPKPTHSPDDYVTVRDAIGDLPPPPPDGSEHPAFPNHRLVAVSAINVERLSHVPEGGGRLDVPPALQLPCHRKANGHRHLDVFGRLWWDRPSGTITAMFDNFTRGRFAHPSENRNITSREGARLMSFPDDFVFVGPKKDVARQIGNAVCPRLAHAVGSAVREALERSPVTLKKPRQRVLPFHQQELWR
jgi:DNA (cytosine-5)-methyltransferase 1